LPYEREISRFIFLKIFLKVFVLWKENHAFFHYNIVFFVKLNTRKNLRFLKVKIAWSSFKPLESWVFLSHVNNDNSSLKNNISKHLLNHKK
jgi:hypothetical protein